MSDNQSAEAAEAALYISSLITESRVGLAIAAFVLYEYIITFSDEVNLFWMRKKTGASWLFFIVRYLAMLFYVFLTVVAYAPMSDEVSAIVLTGMNLTLDVVQYLFWAAFSGLRALALTGMNWCIGSTTFALACCMFGMCVWELCLGVSGANIPILGCDGGPNVTDQQSLIIVVVSRTCIIVADIIVIIVTWRYSVKNGISIGVPRGAAPSNLAYVLLVNGTVYFLVLSVLNAIQVLPYIHAFSALDKVVGYDVIVDPLTAVLICRLMLSLQSAHQRALDGGTVGLSAADGQTATLRFASAVVGSLAEPAPVSDFGDDSISLDTLRDSDQA